MVMRSLHQRQPLMAKYVQVRCASSTAVPLDSEDHQMLRKTVRKFVEAEINPNVDKWEKDGKFPAKALFKKAGDLGLLGLTKPTKFGGQGLDFSFELALGEELGTA